MIICDLSSSHVCDKLGPRFAKALAWLRQAEPASLAVGKTIIQGEEIFVTGYKAATKELDQAKWEAHRKYADIQYIVEGQERMMWQDLAQCQAGEYLAEKDFLALSATAGADFVVPAGRLAIFFPEDGHRPGISVPGSAPVFKLVFKVLVD